MKLRPIADDKGVHLAVQRAASGTVEGDPSELRRAIANLVANAIEATPNDGNVKVRIAAFDNAAVEIVVEDNGYGVPSGQRDRLFQRFASNGRAFGGGTGLGLYIVRLIAEKLGGSVSYAPREPSGSVFTLHLPTTGNTTRARLVASA